MTASSGNRKGTTNRKPRTSSQSSATPRKRNTTASTQKRQTHKKQNEFSVYNEVILILVFAVVIFLFLCTVGLIGAKGDASPNIGDYIQKVMLGLFGVMAYVVPLIIFFALAFGISNHNSKIATVKIISLSVLVILVGVVAQMIGIKGLEDYVGAEGWGKTFYQSQKGGGVIFGSVALLCYSFVGKVGTAFIVLVLSIISLVLLTGKSFFEGLKKGGKRIYDTTAEGGDKLKEKANRWREEEEARQAQYEQELLQKGEKEENEKVLRTNRRVSEVNLNTRIERTSSKDELNTLNDKPVMREQPYKNEAGSKKDIYGLNQKQETNDIHEIEVEGITKEDVPQITEPKPATANWYSTKDAALETGFTVENIELVNKTKIAEEPVAKETEPVPVIEEVNIQIDNPVKPKPVARVAKEVKEEVKPRTYSFPPLALLGKAETGKGGNDTAGLKDTAIRLEQTLETFGVKVKVTDYSQGPAVTRYELHPEQGVKVSKIVSLADDIKLNLAVPDIRIEAPIPGKMAVGIEVPNARSTAVRLREMLEINDFKSFPSDLAFAVGKDIGGKPIVTDIAKMPHLLIAGTTGSGKSVCINTLIMSILYKAHPDDVKMIMIDPKVVELSVYNGIPHLMIPVVTDPKQASSALQWGVNEMTERYKKFADQGVRDLKGYNLKASQTKPGASEEIIKKMPQIVIIVDELADLMMVASKEVEESICRLAQLARAAGIHLIIATQRPSVDVITGLIKTNMPSRIAFAVSSGIDSRIILDENGAEKLLGKGDMLFFPQGYAKPVRVQGAYISDQEVSDVVDYIKKQSSGDVYSKEAEEKVLNSMNSGATSGGFNGDERDEYFADAGRFMIEKQKGSIGMLQRFFRIGFNRAARIMDQLEEAGVVSADEGTKPRRILMTDSEFEQFLDGVIE